MSNTSKKNIKLGVFVIIGLVFLTTGIYLLGKQRNLFGQTFRLSGIFDDVNGLQVGNNVRFSGINIGTVEDIQIISDSSVKVDMIIQESVHKYLKKDAVATIGSEGLMGNKVITISAGTSSKPIIKNNGIIRTSRPIDFDEILENVRKTSENAEVITSDLSEIISKVNKGKGTFGMLLNDSILAKHVEQTLINVQKGSEGFSENMEAVKSNWLFRRHFKDKEKEEKEEEKDDKKKGLFKRKSRDE